MGGNFAGFKPFGGDINYEEDNEQTLLRKEKLREMLEPPQPSDEVPPARLPTKEEKELLRLSLTLEVTSPSNGNSPRSESESTSKDNNNDDNNNNDDGRKKNNSDKKNNDIKNITTTTSNTTTMTSAKSTKINTNDKQITSKANIATNTTTTSTIVTTEKAITPNLDLSSSSSSPQQKTVKLRPIVRTNSGRIMFPKVASDGNTNTKASFLGIDTQNVLINIPGIKGLWSIPGERDIFGNLNTCIHSNTPDFVVPAPFTDASIKSLLKDNMIDSEGTTLLRRVAKSIDRVHVYDRSQPTLLVRSPYLSTSVTLPSLDSIRKTEICFGQQKVGVNY
jgi:hypothetical protein